MALKSARPHKPVRELLYVYKDPNEPRCYWFYGVTFAEFFHASKIATPIALTSYDNLLVEGEETRAGFFIVEPQHLPALAAENIYAACGDFMWFDGPSYKHFADLPPYDVANLLYLSKTFTPLPRRSPFIRSLQNRFAYLAHDDGYVLKLYCRSRTDFHDVVERVIRSKAQTLGFDLSSRDVGRRILRSAARGILVDFRSRRDKSSVPVSAAGPFTCMDTLINSLAAGRLHPRLVATISRSGWIHAAAPAER